MNTTRKTKKYQDFDGFVEKFKPKKTTDDCYTPPAIYDAVLDYVRQMFHIDGRAVIRPFEPGGDYQSYDYPQNCVVVDNPPFSIQSEIIRWYCSKGIPFFLFCPGTTGFAARECDLTYIIINETITFTNGAKVAVNFVTNLPCEYRIIIDPHLSRRLRDIQRVPKKTFRKIAHCWNIITPATLRKLANADCRTAIRKTSCLPLHCSKWTGFGDPLLVSSDAASDLSGSELNAMKRQEMKRQERERQERERQERERQERERQEREKVELDAELLSLVEMLDEAEKAQQL